MASDKLLERRLRDVKQFPHLSPVKAMGLAVLDERVGLGHSGSPFEVRGY
jgi:hypothetical protein